MHEFRDAVAVAFICGLVVGAVGLSGVGSPARETDPGPDPESPAFYVSKSLEDCLETRAHGGWVHEVSVDHAYGVTLNATVVHEPGRTVDVTVSRVSSGTYRIDVRTSVEETRTSDVQQARSDSEDCPPATHVELGTSLPTDYRQFEVAVDGRTLLTVENEDTGGELYQLPNPVNATTSAE
ncbi:hypothetical protein [Halorussus sp. MSC15.2]|uniref:hypothetical protein n=1 Tax=Halorussus sp. MSC15.2 TaxID=2283638 RepID=UPI0013D3819C|nr:hypothetical protein [Halorussus sp. MSC15.2]NEU57235.1 hypothetical protein [Halorussus sp. MSC15.2]